MIKIIDENITMKRYLLRNLPMTFIRRPCFLLYLNYSSRNIYTYIYSFFILQHINTIKNSTHLPLSGEKFKSSIFTDILSPEGAITIQIHSMCGGGILGYEGEVIWVILYSSFK